jgi:hypothetical protein
MNKALIQCRTGEKLGFPSNNGSRMTANGFVWYDTHQEHILTNITFRHCGVRSEQYDQYDTSPTRGCSMSDPQSGCSAESSTFGFLTHSDEFTPHVMQATKQIKFDNCGRRFRFSFEDLDTVSGRGQSWYDDDGSISGLNEPTLIGSGLSTAKSWWTVDNDGKNAFIMCWFLIHLSMTSQVFFGDFSCTGRTGTAYFYQDAWWSST